MDVLVCDDHPIVASAIAMTIESLFDATVHIVNSYRDAITVAADHDSIRLCLLDIHLPSEDARAGVQRLQTMLPEARFVLFSGSEEEADLRLTLDLGLHGFLPKSAAREVVDAALRLVLAGGIYLPRGIGQMAMRGCRPVPAPVPPDVGHPQPQAAVGSPLLGTLTDRQHIVLQHVAKGRSNKEIARDLAISPATVKAHVAQIIAVFGAANRTEAASRALGLGLIDAG